LPKPANLAAQTTKPKENCEENAFSHCYQCTKKTYRKKENT